MTHLEFDMHLIFRFTGLLTFSASLVVVIFMSHFKLGSSCHFNCRQDFILVVVVRVVEEVVDRSTFGGWFRGATRLFRPLDPLEIEVSDFFNQIKEK